MPLGGSGSGKGSSSAIKAGEAFIEVSANDSKLNTVLNRIAGKMKRVGSIIAGIGAGISAAGTLVLAPLLGLFKETADRADRFNDLADKLDASTEALSRLGYAAELSGSSMEGIERAAKLLSKATIMANKGTDEQIDALSMLGTTADEFAGMDLDQKMLKVATALDGMSDPLQKNRLLFALFGKSGMDLKPMFSGGAEGLRELLEEADKVGATVSTSDAKNAAKVMDAFDRSWKAVKYTIMSVGAAIFDVAGGVENASKVFINITSTIKQWIDRNRALILTITAVAAGVVAVGAVITVLGLGIAAVGYVITSLIAIWGALTAAFTAFVAVGGFVLAAVFSPIGIAVIAITAGLAALVAAFLYLGDSTTGVLGSLKELFSGVYDTFQETFGGIMAALQKGDLQLAFEIAMKGMQLAWNQTILVFKKVWNGFKSVFVDGFKIAVAGIKMLFTDMFGFLKLGLLSYLKFYLDKLVWIANKTGATDLLKGLGADPNNLARTLDAEVDSTVASIREKVKPITDELNADLDARRAEREKDLEEQRGFIDMLKDELAVLVARANEKAPEKPKGEMGAVPNKMDVAVSKLAAAVQGTFGSSNYRGSLAVMSGQKKEAEKQTALQTKMEKHLANIEGNLDNNEFE